MRYAGCRKGSIASVSRKSNQQYARVFSSSKSLPSKNTRLNGCYWKRARAGL
jgi:hypothetical protein